MVTSFVTLTLKNSFLFTYSETQRPKWMSEVQVHDLIKKGTKFMDITDHQEDEDRVIATRENSKYHLIFKIIFFILYSRY